jgi:hypothetical protein
MRPDQVNRYLRRCLSASLNHWSKALWSA